MAQAEKSAETQAPKKKPPVKTIIIVLGLLIAEGAGMFFVLGMTGKPSEIEAAEVHGDGDGHGGSAPSNKPVEIQVVKDRFPNNSTGRGWIWDTEIVVQVDGKHAEHVQKELENRSAEIRTGLARVWRTAQHTHFNEPGLETLTRQAQGFLDDVFRTDADGEPYIRRVLIAKCVGFPSDY